MDSFVQFCKTSNYKIPCFPVILITAFKDKIEITKKNKTKKNPVNCARLQASTTVQLMFLLF